MLLYMNNLNLNETLYIRNFINIYINRKIQIVNLKHTKKNINFYLREVLYYIIILYI